MDNLSQQVSPSLHPFYLLPPSFPPTTLNSPSPSHTVIAHSLSTQHDHHKQDCDCYLQLRLQRNQVSVIAVFKKNPNYGY